MLSFLLHTYLGVGCWNLWWLSFPAEILPELSKVAVAGYIHTSAEWNCHLPYILSSFAVLTTFTVISLLHGHEVGSLSPFLVFDLDNFCSFPKLLLKGTFQRETSLDSPMPSIGWDSLDQPAFSLTMTFILSRNHCNLLSIPCPGPTHCVRQSCLSKMGSMNDRLKMGKKGKPCYEAICFRINMIIASV